MEDDWHIRNSEQNFELVITQKHWELNIIFA